MSEEKIEVHKSQRNLNIATAQLYLVMAHYWYSHATNVYVRTKNKCLMYLLSKE